MREPIRGSSAHDGMSPHLKVLNSLVWSRSTTASTSDVGDTL